MKINDVHLVRKSESLPFHDELAHELLPVQLVRIFTVAAHSYELRASSIWSSNKKDQKSVALGKIFK